MGNLNPFIGTVGGKPIQMEVSTTIWYLNEVILKGGFIAKMKYITNVKEIEQENYYSAFCYISKYDTEIYLNSGHPKNINTKHCHNTGSPNTKYCHKMYARRRSEASNSSKVSNTKSKLLSNLDVPGFIVQNNAKTQTQLLPPTVNVQTEIEKRDLTDFFCSHTSKSLDQLIHQTSKMQNAQITLQRQNKMLHGKNPRSLLKYVFGSNMWKKY